MADLVTFTEEILNGKFHVLCSVYCLFQVDNNDANFEKVLPTNLMRIS